MVSPLFSADIFNSCGLEGVLFNEPLNKHCSWSIGGPADFFIEPDSVDNLLIALDIVRQEGMPFIVIGSGTNLLFDDNGFRGLIIKISHKMSKIKISENLVYAESGLWVPMLFNR